MTSPKLRHRNNVLLFRLLVTILYKISVVKSSVNNFMFPTEKEIVHVINQDGITV